MEEFKYGVGVLIIGICLLYMYTKYPFKVLTYKNTGGRFTGIMIIIMGLYLIIDSCIKHFLK